MQCWVVLRVASALLLLSGALTFRAMSQRRVLIPGGEMNCFQMPSKVATFDQGKLRTEGWRPAKIKSISILGPATPFTAPNALNTHEIVKRYDHLFPEGDIVKEHAKLVQDINSLRQVLFVPPVEADVKDYEESIYHEVIETSSTTTQKPSVKTTKPPPKPVTQAAPVRSTTKAASFPVILLGGASQKQAVRAQPQQMFKMPRPTISLIGSSSSPLVRHPYPFVGQATSQRPVKICMTTLPSMIPTTRRPSLWNRLFSLFPRFPR